MCVLLFQICILKFVCSFSQTVCSACQSVLTTGQSQKRYHLKMKVKHYPYQINGQKVSQKLHNRISGDSSVH